MKVCTFFGHRNTPMEVEEKLKMRIEQIITEGKADTFLIGNNGNFDALAEKVLKELSKRFSDIKYSVVLAYIPREKKFWDTTDYSKTVYPKCLEGVPPKYAISKRNEWMLKEADIVITYVTHHFGGSGRFKELAEKKGKTVINIAEKN